MAGDRKAEKRAFHSKLNFRITCGLILALLVVGIPFFIFFYQFHQRKVIESLRKPLTDLSQLVLTDLEKRMLESQPHLLDQDISDLSAKSGAARIMILDNNGEVKVSSDAELRGRSFRIADPLCSDCHSKATVPAQTTTLESGQSGKFLRNIFAIRNQPECFECHSSSQPLNGILVVDLPAGPAFSRFHSGIAEVLVLAGIMLAVTIVVLSLLIDRLILRRIVVMQRTAQAIRKGNLEERVPLQGEDEISELANSFNRMTATLKDSLKEVQRNKAYLEKIINGIEDEIVVVDQSLRTVAANNAYLKNFQDRGADATAQACLGRDKACHPGLPSNCPARATFQSGFVEKCLHTYPDKDGNERCIEIYCYPLRDENDEIFQAIEVRRDITERRFMEARLCHSERLASLGLLASGISHEINNPLACIVTCSEGLQKRASQGTMTLQAEEMNEYLGLIHKEAMRAKAITERLLILSHNSDSPAYLVSINRSLEETIQLMRFQAESKKIEIVEIIDPRLPEIKASDPALRQVFLNLLINAIQAIEAGGRITVRTALENDAANVTIEDDGCGIPSEDLGKLFEPFFSRRMPGKGTGLGLFISRVLLRQMGGVISVQSEPGKGTAFTVRLPLADDESPGHRIENQGVVR
jgi:two-component system, NtrC family, sensor kinase